MTKRSDTPGWHTILWWVAGWSVLALVLAFTVRYGNPLALLEAQAWVLTVAVGVMLLLLAASNLMVGIMPAAGIGLSVTTLAYSIPGISDAFPAWLLFLGGLAIGAIVGCLTILPHGPLWLMAVRGTLAGSIHASAMHGATISVYGMNSSVFTVAPLLALLAVALWTAAGFASFYLRRTD